MTAAGPGSTRKFTILFVCSGNICRSPLAQALLVSELGDDADRFVVRSAGTVAIDGDAMDETAAAQAVRLGADPSAHRAAELTAAEIGDADLVLTAERAHRAAVVGTLPRASRKTFTILQFARVLAGLEARDRETVTDPVTLVAAVAAARGMVPPPDAPEDDDVADPYRRDVAVHEAVAEQLDRAVGAIAAALRDSLVVGEAS